ncbi:MAG: PepSY-associated TM helix domain-containing protein [Pseudomonadota bacterium]
MVRKLHKYISLTLVAVWLVQAITGVSNVFYRELDAALLSGFTAASPSFDESRWAAKIDELRHARQPARLSSVYASGGSAHEFDVFLHTADDGLHVLRVNREGRVLREQPWAVNVSRSGVLLSMRLLHETLLIGSNALVFIGLSGIFLLSNLLLGIRQAWQRRGQWWGALSARSAARGDLRLLAWHRAAGSWLAIPLIVVVGSGVGVAFTDQLEALAGPPTPGIQYVPDDVIGTSGRISLAKALAEARTLYPDAKLSIISMPSLDRPYYDFRFVQAHELRRVFGKTSVAVDALTGNILADFDQRDRPAANRFIDALYATHTGEIGGLAGRLIVFSSGVGLTVLMVFGLSLWWSRRRLRAGRSGKAA